VWERRGAYIHFVRKPERKNHLEDLGLDGRTMLKCIFNRWDGVNKLDLSGSRYRQITGCSECSNEPPEFRKIQEISFVTENLLVSQGGIWS
jgi:hypothetical protein